METFIKVSLYSAIITIAFLQSTTSFAQSWEPENAWDEHDSWETATSPQKPAPKTPSSASANTQNNDDDNWDAAPSTPKTSSANDNWDAAPSTPKTSSANDSWDAAPSPKKPSPKPPFSASANTQNNNGDNWDAAPSTPKTTSTNDSWDTATSSSKKTSTNDSWDAAPSTPKASSANDSWDATSSSSNSHSSFSQSSSTRPTYTDNAIENSKFVIRVGGGFTYLYYGSIGATNGSKHRAFHYPGANGNLAFNYCINSHCIGVDQILATVYTYKGSGNHFLGSTHINYINRNLLTDRFMLEFGAGGGVTYASNSNYKEKRVFAGNGLALSLKLYFLCTFFITKNIGIGLNAAPIGLFEFGLSNHPDANNIKHLPISIGVDAGLHVMFKY